MAGRAGCSLFFFNDTATTEIYTLSLHDALPISLTFKPGVEDVEIVRFLAVLHQAKKRTISTRSEEHTSELQSPDHLVCRLLLEKKKIQQHRRPAAFADMPHKPRPRNIQQHSQDS